MYTCKVVSDLICPWCYIGKRRLEAALAELRPGIAVAVTWHPFQLNPEMPARGMDRNDYRKRKFGNWERCQELDAQVKEVGKTVGIDFRCDLQSNTPNTLNSHRVIWLAGLEGVQDAVVEALFRAYFCEGVNLSDRRELIQVAEGAGLDWRRVERLLDCAEGVAEIDAQEREVKAMGVTSVPLFIIQDRLAVSGAQPAEALLNAFKEAQAFRRKQKVAGRESADLTCGPSGPAC